MTNSLVLAQIGEALYGQRWKADLAGDIGLSARTLRLYAAGSQPVPDAVVERARGLARARAEALLALAGYAAPIAAASTKAAPVAVPLDPDEYVALARRLGGQRPAGLSQRSWAARCATEQRVRSIDTGVPMTLKGVGTLRLQLWGEVGRLESIDLNREDGRAALQDLTLAEPV